MRVPVNAPQLGAEEARAVARVLESGMLSGGPLAARLERAVARATGSRYAVSAGSGTAALRMALAASGVGPGDEVIVPSFTFPATAGAVEAAGARPVFVDVDGYTMDPAAAEAAVTGRTRAIMPVHAYGGMARMGELSRIARRSGLRVIEDAAQALGSSLHGKKAGAFGHAGAFSMYATKVATAGEGGVAVTGSKRAYSAMLAMRGAVGRMSEVHAAIGLAQLAKLGPMLRARRRNARLLSEMLGGGRIRLPGERAGERANWSLYTVEMARRDAALERLRARGFGATVYYRRPLHVLYRTGQRLPGAERAARRVLSLPVHPGVSEDDLRAMARIAAGI